MGHHRNAQREGLVEIVPLTVELARDVACRLRKEDLLEIVGLSGASTDPRDHLEYGARQSVAGVAGCVGGSPAAVGGLIPTDEDTAMLWLLGTPELDTIPLTMCKAVRAFVQAAASRWSRFWALSHSENVSHHHWLRWLGFRETSAYSILATRHTFKVFTVEMPNV